MTLKVASLSLEDAKVFSQWQEDPQTFLNNMEFCLSLPMLRRCFSLKSGEHIVAILGASWISHGVWEAWLYPGQNINSFAKRLVREVRDFTDWMLTQDVHRIQMAVLEGNKKWAAAIGFQFEGIVKNYHSNKDHYMYIKVGA